MTENKVNMEFLYKLLFIILVCSGGFCMTKDYVLDRTIHDNANKLFNEFFEWKLVNNPQFATKIGISKYNDRITEMSLSSYKRRADDVRLYLGKLNNITRQFQPINDESLALDIDLLRDDFEQYLSGLNFTPFLFPINHMEGPHNDHLNLIAMMPMSTADDMRNIVIRIRLFSQQIDEMVDLLREGIRLKRTMSRRSFEKLGKIYGDIANSDVEDNPFFATFKQKPFKIPNKLWVDVYTDARQSIKDYVIPSFRKLQYFLMEEYLPNSRPDVALSSLPNGKQFYQGCLKYHTTTNLDPLEIHRIGLREVQRITARMESLRRKVKFNGTLTQFRKYLRKDERFGFKDENDILNFYRGLEAQVRKLLPKYISRIPTLPLAIEPVPHEIAPTAPFAYYDEPSPDGTRPGTFYVNTYLPKKRRKYIGRSLFLHEALPGHHLQIASRIQFGSPVLFRKYAGMDVLYYEAPGCFARNSAYVEGWGLYSEFLGEEMGLYSNPYDLFGRLSQEMLRAARLVVDTGMHALGWSRAKAISFMRINTAGNIHDIMSETDRYISWPGQACSYKIGELKIKEMRHRALKELGDKFDLRDFHDFFISLGNIPLTVVEKQFQLYLKKKVENE